MKKRLLSALCAVMLLICAVPMASAQTGDAARRADALTVLHLLSEDPGRDLTAPATRAQAAVLLVRLAGGEKKPDTDGWFAGFRDAPLRTTPTAGAGSPASATYSLIPTVT